MGPLVVIGVILAIWWKDGQQLSHLTAIVVVLMVCVFVSWGPLGWLIPSKTFPMETRSAGQSVNLLFTFIVAQAFLSTLCHFKYGIFFFAGWVLIMSAFVLFLLLKMKNVPIDEMKDRVWKKHWLWKRFFIDADLNDEDEDVTPKKDNAHQISQL